MKEQYLNEIIKSFDFKRVNNIMIACDWKWYTKTGEFRVPDVLELKESALHLLNEVYDSSKFTTISSGGFKVERKDDGIELSFVVEDTFLSFSRGVKINRLLNEI